MSGDPSSVALPSEAIGFGAVGSRHSTAVGDPSYSSHPNTYDRVRESSDPSPASASSQVAPVWEQDESSPPPAPAPAPVTSFIPPVSSVLAPTTVMTPPVVAKKSSFVVLRGAKGDAALTERRSVSSAHNTPSIKTVPLTQDLDIPLNDRASDLKQRNSLKPFLDAEGSEAHEDWEKGLQDERDREAEHLSRGEDQYASEPLPNSTFAPLGSHSRASTYHQPPSDPWNQPEEDPTNPIRRHSSLNNFRSRVTPSSDSAPNQDQLAPDTWVSHDRLASGASSDEGTLYGTLAANYVRTRSGTSPAPLPLHHSQSLRSAPGGHSGGLSHSNSISSNHSLPIGLTHSHSLSRDRGTLSPVGGFSRSPWSPTFEETKQLGSMGSVVAGATGLKRGGSGSSRGSAAGRYAEASNLTEDFSQLDVGSSSRKPTPPVTNFYDDTLYESRAQGSSPRPHGANVNRSATGPQGHTRRLPVLSTNIAQATAQQQASAAARHGPASAVAFVPPIGHSSSTTYHERDVGEVGQATAVPNDEAGSSSYDWQRQKELVLGGAAPTLDQNSSAWSSTSAPIVPTSNYGVTLAMQQQQQQIQMLQTQMQQATEALNLMRSQGVPVPIIPSMAPPPPPPGHPQAQMRFGPQALPYSTTYSPAPPMHVRAPSYPRAPINGVSELLPAPVITSNGNGPPHAFSFALDSPIDIHALIAEKGYNPVNFDLRPQSARFFVIKSYTEEDVHKSLKHSIWASTDLGNKRLDRAFRESSEKGPVYLFFSVNASGHFAGVAEMLTSVDYATTSNVWASDKWKGVLKVRWIFIKDVPLSALRHIRLSNTSENKPVTSSRDTQEVPYDAGLEVLRVMATYPSRTSLLQDYGYYEARTAAAAMNSAENASSTGEQDDRSAHNPHYSRMAASNQQQSQPHQSMQAGGGSPYQRHGSPGPAQLGNPYASPQQPQSLPPPGAAYHQSPNYPYQPQQHQQQSFGSNLQQPPTMISPRQAHASPQQKASGARRFFNHSNRSQGQQQSHHPNGPF